LIGRLSSSSPSPSSEYKTYFSTTTCIRTRQSNQTKSYQSFIILLQRGGSLISKLTKEERKKVTTMETTSSSSYLRGLADNVFQEIQPPVAPISFANFSFETSSPSSNNNSTDSSNSTSSQTDQQFLDERLGLVVFLVSTITAILLVGIMIVREYYFKKYGTDICPIFKSTTRQEQAVLDRVRRQRTEQYSADRALAEELQRQLNEEEREQERIVKRTERRRWYEYYLTPYCTVRDKNILYFIIIYYNSIYKFVFFGLKRNWNKFSRRFFLKFCFSF
jgi:hypothetical protein